MENVCNFHSDHVTRIKKVEKTCEELDDRLTDLDKSTAVINQEVKDALKNLSKLPETMEEINRTMLSMQKEISVSNQRIGDLDGKFNSLSNKINEIDEDGKFNIRKWVKDNWITISVLIVGGIYFGKRLIE